MGVLEQNNRRKGITLGEAGNSLVLLLAINAFLFGILYLIRISYHLGSFGGDDYFKEILPWVGLPAGFRELAHKPWTILTYMFAHEGPKLSGIYMLVSNMLWLWMFGYILQDLTGNRHVAPVYLYGGVAGAIFFLVAANVLPALTGNTNQAPAFLLGAGAPVMAIAVAATFMAPNYKLFPMLHGGISLWIVTLIFIAIDFAMVGTTSIATAIAYLGGGLMGMLYVSRLKAGKDWGQWMHQIYSGSLQIFEPKKTRPSHIDMREEVFYQQGKQPAFKRQSIVTQQKIDDILDKINERGYHYLTEEEKEYLKSASQEVD